MSPQNFPLISIIIVNHNGLHDTVECINSIEDCGYPDYKIFIVDNSEDSNQSDVLYKSYPEIHIIRTENHGYAAACNEGIESALKQNPDFILILNNDVILDKNFFKNILAHTEDKDIGIFTPKINFYSNRELIWSAGGNISALRADAYNYHYKQTSCKVKSLEYCNFSTGCCMLIRTEVFQKAGKFNEAYFLYIEDTEFSKKITDCGYKILLLPDCIVYHKVSSSVKNGDNNISIYYSIRNRLYFSKKEFPFLFPLTRLFLTVSALRQKLKWLLTGESIKSKYINAAFEDFKNGKFGKRTEPF